MLLVATLFDTFASRASSTNSRQVFCITDPIHVIMTSVTWASTCSKPTVSCVADKALVNEIGMGPNHPTGEVTCNSSSLVNLKCNLPENAKESLEVYICPIVNCLHACCTWTSHLNKKMVSCHCTVYSFLRSWIIDLTLASSSAFQAFAWAESTLLIASVTSLMPSRPQCICCCKRLLVASGITNCTSAKEIQNVSCSSITSQFQQKHYFEPKSRRKKRILKSVVVQEGLSNCIEV